MLSQVVLNNIETIQSHIGALGRNDQSFAVSLIDSVRTFERKGRAPSAKQEHWLGVLAQRAVTPRPATVTIGDCAPIVALFDKARERGMTRAAILMQTASGETIRVTVAGSQSRVPGSLNVTDRSGNWAAGTQNRWFGRITRDGQFQPSTRETPPADLIDALRAFAADPAGVARLYGRRTGACCFCARELTDGRSVDVGYGPICADKFGLPWG